MSRLSELDQRDTACDINAEQLAGLQELSANMPVVFHVIVQTD